MYDVCYDTQDFNQAIIIVQKLIEFKNNYKEDLVSLYMKTAQFDKALELINELNETVGKSEKRELYKVDILKDAKYQSVEKVNLLNQIKKFPKEEANYIALIYMYSQSNQEEKALEIAQKLEKEIPTSDWAQVSLFKFHLNNNDGEKAVKAMNIVLPSDKIDAKIKHRILNEFLIFAKNNPQFEPDLDKAIGYFSDDKDVKVAKEIAKFYYSKKDWNKAEKYLKLHLKSTQDDIEAQLLLLQSFTELIQFENVAKKANELTELFPNQPEFYYYVGLANNQLTNYKKAKDFLETGLDLIIDDAPLEINFYIQLGEAFNGLGDMKKKRKLFYKSRYINQETKEKMKRIVSVLLVLLLVSCKSKSFLAEGKASDSMSANSIIQKHYNNKIDFETLYIKASARYEDEKQKQNISADIRIKKDEKILVSVRFLGITMAKALITPSEVKYYEKMNGTYFQGNYESLSQWLGTELDYQKVQNMLLGKPVDNLEKGNYKEEIIDNLYRLFAKEKNADKTFSFESERFLLKKQEIIQQEKNRMVTVNYPNFQTVSKLILPTDLTILAQQEKGKTAINIDYKSISVNEEMTFPYSVPEGYERIFIK